MEVELLVLFGRKVITYVVSTPDPPLDIGPLVGELSEKAPDDLETRVRVLVVGSE